MPVGFIAAFMQRNKIAPAQPAVPNAVCGFHLFDGREMILPVVVRDHGVRSFEFVLVIQLRA